MPAQPSAWTRPLDLAWEAFLEGSIPVGCVVTDASGAVVAEGRNRVSAPAGPGLSGTYIAHAEMNALASLPPGEYGDHTIWSTLEPCFMCTGAIVHSHVGVARFAAADPFIAGVEGLPGLNPWVARRWPQRHGPETGPVGELAGLLHVAWHVRRKPEGTVVSFYAHTDPDLIVRARAALDVLADPPATWQEAADLLGIGPV